MVLITWCLISLASIVVFSRPVFATYTASIATSESIVINATGAGNGVSVHNEPITVTSTCTAGYNLTLSTTQNSTLYRDGDDENDEETFSAVNASYALSDLTNNANTWGYSLNGNYNTVGAFSPLSTEPVFIKTISETATEEESIEDEFSVYFGAAVSAGFTAGSYKMADNGVITYYLTISESCSDSAVVSFNENINGEGGEGTDETISNIPTTNDNVINNVNRTVTLASEIPTRSSYMFKEWNTEADGTGEYYYAGQTVPMGSDGLSGFVTLYAIWIENCARDTICYDGNHADAGTMDDQAVTTNKLDLTPSNFSRAGYGFAGWNTMPDGSGTNYGPGQNITPGDLSSTGLMLFAKWLEPVGVLQTWAGASNMSVGDVIALRDNRDDEVYTVAKLADNKVWTVENLRLVPSTANITTNNTNKPTATFIENAPSSSSSTTQCSGASSTWNNSTCLDHIYYYLDNMDRSKTQSPIGNYTTNAWYSYGAMYNWYTATAGNGTYSKTSGNVAGDICPAGWHLPNGGTTGEYYTLASTLGGNSAGTPVLRTYPNNFIFSGDYNPSSGIPDGRGVQGRLWHGTASNGNNAYRMGYNSSTITPVNTYNKWDNFAVRCIYQGGNIPFSDVEVDFAGSGITSLTFTSQGYDTVTATPASSTVALAENVTYTVTATLTSGYEVTSWSTAAGGTLGSLASNPAINPNTYTITGETALTVTGAEIPSYTVTVNLGANVSSVGFYHATYGTQNVVNQNVGTETNGGAYTGTVSLKRGEIYTLSPSFEEGYSLDEWETTANGTLGSTTATSTSYTVTGAATLSIAAEEADELSYVLVYDAGTGTDAPDGETVSSYDSTHDFTITNSAPINYGYTFTGWSETADASGNGTTVDYTSGNTVTVTSTGTSTTKTLYAVYTVNTCPSGKICYFDNGADVINGGRGTMANQTASSNSSVTLIPTNYSKTGYGFAGWAEDTNTTPYGSNATISTGDLSSVGLSLYAKWVESAGVMQNWSGCSGLAQNSVTALTDNRDNNTYAVAKLADGNCWTIENLRLDPGLTTITNANTHNPTSTFVTQSTTDDGAGNPVSLSANTMCKANDDTSCINSIQYNTNSLNRSLTASYNTAANNVGWYSYGVYYNWYTATAGNGVYSMTSNSSVNGDICPKKWKIPTGNSTGVFKALNDAVNSGSTGSDAGLRAYPVNFIWSGDYNNDKRTSGYSNGRIWTATTKDNPTAYRVGFASNTVTASTNTFNKWDGFIVRCIFDLSSVNYYDVTVTIPEYVTSVTFESASYGTQTATSGNNVVSLAEGASYTITANLATGYDFAQWQNGTNSTLGSSSANPTTISVTNDTTLALTTQLRASYTITVNFDDHVSSIGFYNANYGTLQLTPQNSTDNGNGSYTGAVTLYDGIAYTVSSVFEYGYRISSWSTTANGTLSSTTNSTATYTVTGTATLTLTSQGKTGATTLDTGQNINAKMKTLAEGTNKTYSDSSSKIKALAMADSLPADFTPSEANTISVSNSEKPIYIFFDNTNNAGIMYFYTEARDIYMNADSSSAFYNNSALSDISALADWNANVVISMSSMFFDASSLTNIDALSNWDTSNVTDMSRILADTAITNLDALANWDTSSVTDMYDMFGNHLVNNPGSLINIDGLSGWDTSNVTNMGDMFYRASSLTNIDALSNWDTSNVTSMRSMFNEASSLTNIDGLSGWDTSNVTNMREMFWGASSLTNIDALSNWDTSNVVDMRSMFRSTDSLSDASGINDWDIGKVIIKSDANYYSSNYFYEMFYDAGGSSSSPIHPNFTKRVGTWDNNGTFIPGGLYNGDSVTVTVVFDSHIDQVSVHGNSDGTTVHASGITVSLTRGASYTIFASSASGYELATWDPGDNGVISPNQLTLNEFYEVTFIPTGDTTLTATSQLIPSDVTTTVNMDSHVSRVTFHSDKYDDQTATTNGDTVTLKQGTTYKVTATTESGYEVSSWATTGGAISNNAGKRTNFTSSGNSTLTVTSTSATTTHTVTVSMDSNVSYVTFTNDNWPTRVAIGNNDTVELRDNTTYIATAYTKTGYELASWSTTANGTLGSTTTNPSTYTVVDDATITVTSSSIPTYTVAVNLDAHFSSVLFTNTKYGKQIATSSNPTVTLRRGVEYTISATIDTGYEFASWSTTANGTLGSTTTNPTSYAVTDDATLTTTGIVSPDYTVTVNLDAHSSSVTLYNADLGTQSVTNSNNNGDGTHTGTVTLIRGVNYTISASFDIDYRFGSWSTTADGVLDNATNNVTTYIVSNTATLSLASQVKSGRATLDTGQNLSVKMKTLAEGVNKSYSANSSKIKALRMASSLPADFAPSSANTVSISSSQYPIYIFFDNTNNAGIMYFYTEARNIYMNTDSSHAFQNITALSDISALADWNANDVIDMSYMFFGASSLVNIDALSNWDTGNVTTLSYMFDGASSLANIDGAKNWDTGNVATLSNMFDGASSLVNIDGAKNWDTSNVINLESMFEHTSITNLDGLSDWDTSNVTTLSNMFDGASSLANIDGAKDWDTSNVTKMSNMFDSASSLTNLDALSNWDTGNVTEMREMFYYTTSLSDASGINDWDIRKVKYTLDSANYNNFYHMFYYAGGNSIHPTFTKRTGSWSVGTFAPEVLNSGNATVTVVFDSHISRVKVNNTTVNTSGNSVTLACGTTVNVTATLRSGYEIATWDPGDNGVIPSNQLTEIVSFTPTGNTILTVTSQPMPDNITTTVNMDSHVSKLTFHSDKYNDQTVTTNGGTVRIRQGATYKVTATTESGYEVSSWATTGGAISNNAGKRTNFTSSGNSTLTVTSTSATTTHTVTVSMDSNVSYVTFTNDNWPTRVAIGNNDTVELRDNTTYNATAHFSDGTVYEVYSWSTTANGTLTNNNTNPAINPNTYTVTGDATFTVVSCAIPTYTVTVSLDAHSSSVTFTNTKYGKQIATSSNPTVTLRRGVEYIISATFDTGYEFASWSTTANGTLGSTTTNPTSYAVTDDAVLTVASSAIPDYAVTVNLDAHSSGVTFYNDDYGTQSVTNSNNNGDGTHTGAVTLKRGVSYIVSASYDVGYISGSWSTTASGVLSNTIGATTYTISNIATLSLTSQARTGTTTLVTGQNLNAKIKSLAEGVNEVFSAVSSVIRALRMADSLPDDFIPSNANTVSISSSEKPVYIFFDNSNNAGIMYFYTEARNIYMNANSDSTFCNNTALSDISALSDWDTSNVTNMGSMFSTTSSLTNLNALSDWDTSNVTNMGNMFYNTSIGTSSLTNLNGLSDWDTSNVTNMSSMFYRASSLTNLDGLSNWDTSNVTNMYDLFFNTSSLTNLDGLSNWDTSSVTNMVGMFGSLSTGNSSLTNLDGLSNWDTSNVTNMSSMFYCVNSLTNLDALSDWDTSNVMDMSYMFFNTSLSDASGINGWDVSNVIVTSTSINDTYLYNNYFYEMFYSYDSSTHPTFTKRAGTWNDDGTFIPGNTTSGDVVVTVIFDSHINWVRVGDITVSNSGGTVSISRGGPHIITAFEYSNYELATWDPGDKGIINLNQLTLNDISFTPTGNTTLTATSQPIPSNITTTVNMDSHVSKVTFHSDKYTDQTATTNGDTVTLKQGATYKVTAYTDTGYEVSSWTTTGGTVSNNAGKHTSFTPSGSFTLSVTSTTAATTHTVTVNMDSNVSYVTFTNDNWPNKTAIRNGFEVELRDNTPYTVTAYNKNGYELDSWVTTNNSTLSSTSTNPTTYTVTGDSTLTATSTAITP